MTKRILFFAAVLAALAGCAEPEQIAHRQTAGAEAQISPLSSKPN